LCTFSFKVELGLETKKKQSSKQFFGSASSQLVALSESTAFQQHFRATSASIVLCGFEE
jgi:hypothetical protein